MPSSRSFAPEQSLVAAGLAVLVSGWKFLRWVLGGTRLFQPSLRFAPIGIGLWLITGFPDRTHDYQPMVHGFTRGIAAAVGIAVIAGFWAYWEVELRHDEPPRIRSRWERRR